MMLPNNSAVTDFDGFRACIYRITFTLAGIYNLAFGAWAGFRPLDLFQLLRIDAPRYPSIWACMGMVVGVYGLLYWYAAWRLDRAWPIIAVGLLGKVLGPAGFMVTVTSGELPPTMLSLLVFNDLIWWLPLGMFLLEGTSIAGRLRDAAPYLCAAVHAAAIPVLIFMLAGGSQLEADVSRRATYIVEHVTQWRAGWAVWMVAAGSLLGFYVWWAARTRWTTAGLCGVLVAAAGMCCDLSGEALLIAWLPEQATALLESSSLDVDAALASFVAVQDTATALTAMWANGLYTLGGVILTLATPSLGKRLLTLVWIIWIAGFGMSVSAACEFLPGITGSTAVLFPLFVVWCVLLGRRLR